MKISWPFIALTSFTLLACAASDVDDADLSNDETVESASDELTASCSGNYVPMAKCSGSTAIVWCQNQDNPNKTNGRRTSNCGAQDKICKKVSSKTANCVKP